MRPETLAKIADGLLRGELSADAAPWDVAAAVTKITDAVTQSDATITAVKVRKASEVLNKLLHYAHTRLLGETWNAKRGFDPTIVKHWAQALINLGALDVAENLLKDGLPKLDGAGAQAAREVLEYQGLLGRIAKQRFVESDDLDRLTEALEAYLRQYEQKPTAYWHGINAVALRARLESEGVAWRGATVEMLARTVYDQALKDYVDAPGDYWPVATVSEACLALGRCDDAELWLHRLLNHENVQPFGIESYGRQLREIWGGDVDGGANVCADRLVRIVTRHVARTQAKVSVSTDAVAQFASPTLAAAALEKNFSGERTITREMLERMIASCSSIGCVSNRQGERLGTGFLVAGSALKTSWGDVPVFVTNAHVISDSVANAIRVENALVSFEVESAKAGAPVYYPVAEMLFTSPPGDVGVRSASNDNLDVTVVRLRDLPAGIVGLATTPALPVIDPRAKAFVVGHPLGSGLQISLHDSVLLDYDDDQRLIHYRTPSDPGSSGSPVFNAQWNVIALHHAGSSKTPRLHGTGTYEANEGIVLAAIKRKLESLT